ncbi:MAG TPA: 2-amino-4-hydroxy-6-hydroxymethyldihydropteridine diphosphokinase [Longimicrobiales bacterium]|nr:2-amino-4-hydroxy-6-hydroxymethyldihydropteridine diphosphokinase [Longimicrobiales bacterium]
MGSNVGDRAAHLRGALRGLARHVTIEAVSAVYESEPVGYREQGRFWNLAVRGRTRLAPTALLRALQTLELELGRVATFPMGPRTIDIDLLLYGDARIRTKTLVVPHERLLERPFVLQPLLDLDVRLRHPVTREWLAIRLAALGGASSLDRLGSAHDVLGDLSRPL